ncbi:hypothetical protein B0T13DRAFT_505203 [Neurospora crassa]|nr:hypothetical protein B0T13DRAFT_505203 [Neurospora crassa]
MPNSKEPERWRPVREGCDNLLGRNRWLGREGEDVDVDKGGARGALINAKRLNNPSCHIADPLLRARMLRNRECQLLLKPTPKYLQAQRDGRWITGRGGGFGGGRGASLQNVTTIRRRTIKAGLNGHSLQRCKLNITMRGSQSWKYYCTFTKKSGDTSRQPVVPHNFKVVQLSSSPSSPDIAGQLSALMSSQALRLPAPHCPGLRRRTQIRTNG